MAHIFAEYDHVIGIEDHVHVRSVQPIPLGKNGVPLPPCEQGEQGRQADPPAASVVTT
jgi:hypothetical protein